MRQAWSRCAAATAIVAVVGWAASVPAQAAAPSPERTEAHAYQYAVTPERDPGRWGQLVASGRVVEALQISPGELDAMTTPQLLEAVLDYPMLGNFQAYSSVQDGIEAVRREFAGLDELLRRPDVARVALDAYSTADLERLVANEEFPTITLSFLELLLAQPEVLGSLGAAGRQALVSAVLEQLAVKRAAFATPFYGESGSSLVLMRSLRVDSADFAAAVQADPLAARFLATGSQEFADQDLAAETQSALAAGLNDAYGLDVNGAARLPGPSDFTGAREFAVTALGTSQSTVYTPKRTRVPVIVSVREPLTAAQIKDNNMWVMRGYPSAVMLRGSTGKYNCHSYAWFNQATSNNVWMNDPSAYMRDGSYRRVVSTGYVSTVPSAAPANPRVYYVGGNHSGIRYSSTRVVSKWGVYGLMRHAPNYTPYSTTTGLTYWTST